MLWAKAFHPSGFLLALELDSGPHLLNLWNMTMSFSTSIVEAHTPYLTVDKAVLISLRLWDATSNGDRAARLIEPTTRSQPSVVS